MSDPKPVSNFIRNIIDADLAANKFKDRRWSGKPGPAASHAAATPDSMKIRTRFPPEPNGYLHFGHAKSICLNFGLAQDYGGACHLRFDDTNPEKEEQEYVDSIVDAVKWLGFDWGDSLYYASNYFDWMYEFAEYLIQAGHAYVDSQSAEEMRANRGTLTEPGKESPFRDRSPQENLDLFRRMKAGEFPDGRHVLRARIDMASPNINMRDPAIYRIRHAEHHNTGNKWCVYPMYTYAHPIEDALENITHSICTLEFEDQRPFYDWLLERLAEGGLLQRPLPQQIEFARLNLTYLVMSKRKLIQLVEEGHVTGWDDPRMSTLVGGRRRGYTPEGFRLFAERIGVTKADALIDYSVLEGCMREHLEHSAPRVMAVIDPLKVTLTNYQSGVTGNREAGFHPNHPEFGSREVPLSPTLWIEREDFIEAPPAGWQRLTLGGEVRLRYSYVIKCEEIIRDATGHVAELKCSIDHDTLGKNPVGRKVKGVIHWVSAEHALPAEIRLYDRLFTVPQPDKDATKTFIDFLNPDSLKVAQGWVEPCVKDCAPETRYQFERMGYFVADRRDHRPGEKLVFNRTVGLKDSWAKEQG